MGESSHNPVVEIDVRGNEYEVSGFASRQEAIQFISELDEGTSSRVLVRGPF